MTADLVVGADGLHSVLRVCAERARHPLFHGPSCVALAGARRPIGPARSAGLHGAGPASGQLSAARRQFAQHCRGRGTQGLGRRGLGPSRQPNHPAPRLCGVLAGRCRAGWHRSIRCFYGACSAIVSPPLGIRAVPCCWGDAGRIPRCPSWRRGANMALEDAYTLARELDRAPDLPHRPCRLPDRAAQPRAARGPRRRIAMHATITCARPSHRWPIWPCACRKNLCAMRPCGNLAGFTTMT